MSGTEKSVAKQDVEGKQLALPSGDDADLAAKEARLEELERGIERRYIEIGLALEEIRVEKLYAVRGLTWEQYTRKQWKISSRHANRLRAAARLVEEIGPTGPVPATERAIRPLVTKGPRSAKMRSVPDLVSQLNEQLGALTWRDRYLRLVGGHHDSLGRLLPIFRDEARGTWIPESEWLVFKGHLPKAVQDAALAKAHESPAKAVHRDEHAKEAVS